MTTTIYDSDIVLDLETTGTAVGCPILSIGATTLDLSRSFYITVDLNDCLRSGMYSDQATLDWWGTQPEDTRREAFSGGNRLIETLNDFTEWYKTVSFNGAKQIPIWGNSARFDLGILEHAYMIYDLPNPWHYRNERCYRTVKALFPHIAEPTFEGMKHHALEDARHEARHLKLILDSLKRGS